jgi:hypothetical protein
MTIRRCPFIIRQQLYSARRADGQQTAATRPRRHRALLFGCLIALSGMASPLDVRASSLLATFNDMGGFGIGAPNADIPQQQILALSYTFHIVQIPNGPPLLLPTNPPAPPCLGCEPVPTGFTGTTDYTSANTTEFGDFAAHLTNGIDGGARPRSCWWTGDRRSCHPGGRGQGEIGETSSCTARNFP